MTYGNLAYKYDYREEEKPREQKSTVNKKRVKSRKKKNEISYLSKVISVLVLAASAIFMITQFVNVNETQTALEEKRSEYAFEESVTSQKSFELEQSVDLSKIEEEATTRLGMQRPEAHQIVYVDVKQDDVTEKTAGEVEGLGNRIAGFFSSVISNIIEFFSI